MELRRATREQIAGLRTARSETGPLPITPGFYAGLAEEAEPFLLIEPSSAGGQEGDGGADGEDLLGYALLLRHEHEGHAHVTLIELDLGERHQDRYEDVLDLIRDEAKPTAYLVRTDDCRLNATLLARGLQVEPTALVMVPELSRGSSQDAGASGAPLGAGVGMPPSAARWELDVMNPSHIAGVAELLEPEESEAEGAARRHRHGSSPVEVLDEVRVMADAGTGWVFLDGGRPEAVVARLATEDGQYELLDFVVAQGEEAGLSWAVSRASESVLAAGRRPVAVIDALDPVRRRILRAAGYFTAAAYMVFYDPVAGRPSVPTVSLQELRAMIEREEPFRLVDVLGEEHWNGAHIPGSEWIDFRGLGREARRRFKPDETIVVYCSGFT